MTSTEAKVTALYTLDRENPDAGFSYNLAGSIVYPVTILAEDSGLPKLSATCFFFINITDVNDNNPEFDIPSGYAATILRTAAVNSRVTRVFAWDKDQNENAEVTYSITEQPTSCGGQACLAITVTDQKKGWVTVVARPDVEVRHFYTISMFVTYM